MGRGGRVEILSSDFAVGWVEVFGQEPSVVTAWLDGKMVGFAEANIERHDLVKAVADGVLDAAGLGFLIVFRQPVPDNRVKDIEVVKIGSEHPMPKASAMRIDQTPKTQVFVLGSPRSGTSELGNTIASQLKLPWLGECHAAPFFATASKALANPQISDNGLTRFMKKQDYQNLIVEETKRAYFYAHGSASFVDKTPGVLMISATPFLLECFPFAKVIYIRRNGISNVLSRMAKFGGSFERHCADWAAALNEWTKVRGQLPHYLELRQEDMLVKPELVAKHLTEYLQVSHLEDSVKDSLRSGSRERTGAGLGRQTLADTGWSPEQISSFRKICGRTMEEFGYAIN